MVNKFACKSIGMTIVCVCSPQRPRSLLLTCTYIRITYVSKEMDKESDQWEAGSMNGRG